ncbi:hypothetical protein BHE74_00008638 [Ensete ventricosum]|nr:hypothetical protein BHE74_00008638 [Ensete ventricosum]
MIGNVPGDRHMLQLRVEYVFNLMVVHSVTFCVDNFIYCRFLSLKNLASVFLQQGPIYYENALHCYLQAVELDENDSVVWNHLGTLSCKMGLLSTSRWAFEQGLLCSPNNCKAT